MWRRISHIQIVSEELSALLAETPATGTYSELTIIDVRGEDFAGGQVKGSVHLAYDELEAQIDDVVGKLTAAKATRVVFVDQSGGQRAPLAAEMLISKFKDEEGEGPAIYVLISGFAGFLNAYLSISGDKLTVKDDSVSDFDPAKWQVVDVPRTPSNVDLPNSAQQVVYKSSVDSANVFVAPTPKGEVASATRPPIVDSSRDAILLEIRNMLQDLIEKSARHQAALDNLTEKSDRQQAALDNLTENVDFLMEEYEDPSVDTHTLPASPLSALSVFLTNLRAAVCVAQLGSRAPTEGTDPRRADRQGSAGAGDGAAQARREPRARTPLDATPTERPGETARRHRGDRRSGWL